MREIVPGITTWSVFSEPIGLDFNGYAIATGSGAILVDPPDPGPDGWEALAELSPSVVLIGTLYVLAHLASNSEYTVMRGSGLSPGRAGGIRRPCRPVR